MLKEILALFLLLPIVYGLSTSTYQVDSYTTGYGGSNGSTASYTFTSIITYTGTPNMTTSSYWGAVGSLNMSETGENYTVIPQEDDPPADNPVSPGGGPSSRTTTTGTAQSSSSTSMKLWTNVTKGERIVHTEEGISVEFSMKKNMQVIGMTIRMLDNKPETIAAIAKPYKYLKIETFNVNVSDLDSAVITFNVPLGWLKNNSYDEDWVVLNRYTDDWEDLPTVKTGSDEDNAYYEAETLGFSYFAISIIEKTAVNKSKVIDLGKNENETSEITGNIVLPPRNVKITVIPIILIIGALIAEVAVIIHLRTVPDPSKPPSHLETFISRALDNGIGKNELRQKLLDKGWEPEIVDDFLEKLSVR